MASLLQRQRRAAGDKPALKAASWRGLWAGVGLSALLAAGLAPAGAHAGDVRSSAANASRLAAEATMAPGPRRAEFGSVLPGEQARQLADWVAETRNHSGQPFFIVDKVHARLYVFDRDARLQATTPVLVGAARGDDSVPGIGSRALAQILPEERTTPAGRFVAEAGRNTRGEDIVWVDYDAAVSMHRVRTGNRLERRAERLATPTVDDNRISYGCINVPAAFYDRHIDPVFDALRTALVYVLPETRSLQQEFGVYDSSGRLAARRQP